MKPKTIRLSQNGQLKIVDQEQLAKTKVVKGYTVEFSDHEEGKEYRPQVLISRLEQNINFLNKILSL